MPLLSTTKHLAGSAPAVKISRMQATLLAPEPMKAILTSSMRLPTTLSALSKPARVTQAVPCWSSCQMGISARSRRVSRIRKHLGWLMSSRLTPPKLGCKRRTVSMKRSGSLVSRQMGTASTPPRYLKSSALPSITGMAALGPMSPRPSTRVPSLTTATVFHLLVYS